ncbi:MAG: SIMPL domain-containing protein [Alphaproteobacteria bacterium]|nr:SIMPL domain-containing protein [Alphaproteobacteria bacterium]
MRIARNLLISSSALILAGTMAACAQMPAAQNASAGTMTSSYHPNSIQPETTLDISAEATVKQAPDIAYINAGVQAEADTAQQAMADQAKAMNSMFEALAAAGIPEKDMQTSNLSLNPVYDYVEETDGNGRRSGKQVLRGYTASNQLTVKVSDLDNLGETLDSLVAAGGNTFNGLSFALEDPSDAQDEARRKAIKDAMSRAELYAEAAGMRVGRIVNISEAGGYAPQPMQMDRMVMNEAMGAKSTPISGGEIGYSAQVSVKFELVK